MRRLHVAFTVVGAEITIEPNHRRVITVMMRGPFDDRGARNRPAPTAPLRIGIVQWRWVTAILRRGNVRNRFLVPEPAGYTASQDLCAASGTP
jgi:hypothetical protein